jgi:hypothetical protein
MALLDRGRETRKASNVTGVYLSIPGYVAVAGHVNDVLPSCQNIPFVLAAFSLPRLSPASFEAGLDEEDDPVHELE